MPRLFDASRLSSSLLFTALGLMAAGPVLAKPAKAPTPDAPGLAAARARMVEDLAALRFDRLGNPQLRWDHIPPVYAPRSKPHHLLVVLVEFSDRGFERFKGEAGQGKKLASHYQNLLFDPEYKQVDTLSHYYRTQSLNTYHVQGKVLPPVKLSKPRAAYGAPKRPKGGSWRNDADPQGMVEEALKLAMAQHKDVDQATFDRWDPTDFDGDGILDEPDGYLDHFVLIYAGGGQSSCQGLFKLQEVFTPNAQPGVIDTLEKAPRECAERLWPHRFSLQQREGQGPEIEGRAHRRGGAPLRPAMWALDYNMQSEYTEASTFIHEFGHSIGLPDIYARTSSNSTGGWEVMSGTASPSPQNLSAWSRIMLGWLRPRVIRPPSFGGKRTSSLYLQTLDDPLAPEAVAQGHQKAGLWRSAMIVLPPKTLDLNLTDLPKKSDTTALYSGQGNELNRTAALDLDLTEITGDVELSFDGWWEIEGGWDFVYVESSTDGGATWTRRKPTDAGVMPAKHGHDGKTTLPGLTGLSGDRDGDGKNESQRKCNPKKAIAHGEEKANAKANPCLTPSWTRAAFDLSDLKGQKVMVRLRYFTDMAAVMRGLLIDNVLVTVKEGRKKTILVSDDFEGPLHPAWRLDGFTRSAGRHTLLVPHFYLLEYRDPYAKGAEHRYDRALDKPRFSVFYDPADQKMKALQVKPRPGVVAWYYDGAFAWSENDPATNGQGRGFLLALDAWPDEIALPGFDALYRGKAGSFETGYDTKGDSAQKTLEAAFFRTVCFVRDAGWYPVGVDKARLGQHCSDKASPISSVKYGPRSLLYSYRIVNDFLPGPERQKYWPVGELLDYRRTKEGIVWRMRDRSLRHLHTYDSPFALEDFAEGVTIYRIQGTELIKEEDRPHKAVKRFDDNTASRWANPKLYFGGVKVPPSGVSFELTKPGDQAPKAARVKIWVDWKE